MFTVVVPLYNKEDHIERALNSILNQTYNDFEIVIVNDGSTDRSIRRVEKYNDNRITVINQTNAGVSAARNTGIKNSNFDYIAFLDADDYWGNDYLNNMNNLIKKYPKLNLYAARYSVIDTEKRKISKKFFQSEKSDFCFDLAKYGSNSSSVELPLHTSSVVARKDTIININGYDERISYYEDYDFFIRLSLDSKVAYLNIEPQSFYCQDVPSDNRITGSIPPLEKHLLYYTDKYENESKYLKYFINRFKARKIIDYKAQKKYSDEVKKIICSIDCRKLSIKDKIILNLNSSIIKKILTAKNKVFNLYNSDHHEN